MIDVRRTGPNAYAVTIRAGGSQSRHTVTLADANAARLGGGRPSEAIVKAAIAFLLDREPKESILSTFDLTVIGRYFPEFDDELPAYLGA